ncbi:MAG: metallophosphoesterase [Flavobacteriales bacterium]
MRIFTLFLILFLLHAPVRGQEIPSVYSNMGKDEQRVFFSPEEGKKLHAKNEQGLSLKRFERAPYGTEKGIAFDMGKGLNGTLYYGFLSEEGTYHFPVYFKHSSKISDGKARIPIREEMSGKYDMIGWEKDGKGRIGYRVLNEKGEMLFQGRIAFSGKGPFKCRPTVVDGPTVNTLTSNQVMIAFRTDRKVVSELMLRPKHLSKETMQSGMDLISESSARKKHSFSIDDLDPSTEYRYKIRYGESGSRVGHFRTAPEKGTRSEFTFAYASDSRAGKGGGERDMYGTNFYIMRRIGALCMQKNAAFLQFTGDMINGYSTSRKDQRLQYMNWRRSLEPYWRYMPVNTTMGNHEALLRAFPDTSRGYPYAVDRFPFDKKSAESLFREFFVNFKNGPDSEDGASYDPNKGEQDFPSYEETVYSYIHDNVAMIVLNSDYWYAPSLASEPRTSGNLHAYIMDRQLEWLEEQIQQYEEEEAIDHIFLTLHTPLFPNGGHADDDMWYGGSNEPRPYVNGEPLEEGIIERRDALLDILVNQSQKVRAILTGDEHNYNKLRIGPGMDRYPKGYEADTIALDRSIWQINNGAAGAPYYAQEKLPWSERVSSFSTKNVLTLFHVNGESLRMEAIDPRSFEQVDSLQLHE